ncbi:MAG: hypothetical protein RR639_08545 [Hydrogenoanaerobacterium sp.]
MIRHPNGNEYKVVYLDTNVISEFVNNTKYTAKNFLERYAMGEYAFVTSVFNIYELSKTYPDFQNKMEKSFGIIPLGISIGIPEINQYEKSGVLLGNNLITFAVGIKPLFNLNIGDLIKWFDGKLKKDVTNREGAIESEIEEWLLRRQAPKASWQKEFDVNLLDSMNEIYRRYKSYTPIENLGVYKSLEVAAYVKNQFIYNSSKSIERNSILDSYNVAVAPYVDVYITEKTVGAWLVSAKERFVYLKDVDIIKLSDLFAPESQTFLQKH